MSYKSNNKIRHPPVQQQSPFSTGQYTAQAQTQQSPETIMIECNRQNALYKGELGFILFMVQTMLKTINESNTI